MFLTCNLLAYFPIHHNIIITSSYISYISVTQPKYQRNISNTQQVVSAICLHPAHICTNNAQTTHKQTACTYSFQYTEVRLRKDIV